MRTLIHQLKDSIYIAWTIAAKDIADALKNRNTLVNIVLISGMVVFFYWVSTVRPFDKRIEVVVYDEGQSELTSDSTELSDGYTFTFEQATSFEEMKSMLRYEHIGIVVPVDFDQDLKAGNVPTLKSYILWAYRTKTTELEEKYNQKFTEFLGDPVNISIAGNIVLPSPEVDTSSVQFHMLYAMCFMAVTVVPFLMIEERRTHTMDALLASPASAGQVVMGKALAGAFYVFLGGGLWFVLHWTYIVNWGLALLVSILLAIFSIGLALVLGSFIEKPLQLSLWILPILFFIVVPAFFSNEPNLAPSLRAVFSWLPTTALMTMLRFALSSHAPLGQLLVNLTIAMIGILVVYTLVIWRMRRLDRQ